MPWDLELILKADNDEWKKLISDLDKNGDPKRFRHRELLKDEEQKEIIADSFYRFAVKTNKIGDTWENCEQILQEYTTCIRSASRSYFRKNIAVECPNPNCSARIPNYDISSRKKQCTNCKLSLNFCTNCKSYFLPSDETCGSCGPDE